MCTLEKNSSLDWKREVYSVFMWTLCLQEPVGTDVDNNLSRIVLPTLFPGVIFVEPLAQMNSIRLRVHGVPASHHLPQRRTSIRFGILQYNMKIIPEKLTCIL